METSRVSTVDAEARACVSAARVVRATEKDHALAATQAREIVRLSAAGAVPEATSTATRSAVVARAVATSTAKLGGKATEAGTSTVKHGDNVARQPDSRATPRAAREVNAAREAAATVNASDQKGAVSPSNNPAAVAPRFKASAARAVLRADSSRLSGY